LLLVLVVAVVVDDDDDDRLDLSWSCASSFAGRNIWGKTTMYYNDQLLSNNNKNVKKEKKMRKWKQAYKEESFVDIKCIQQVSTFFSSFGIPCKPS